MGIKMFPPVKKQLVASLLYLFENQAACSKVLNYTFKSHKKWGARDRKVFAESFYEIVRNLGKYLNAVQLTHYQELNENKIEEVIEIFLNEDNVPEPESKTLKWTAASDLLEVIEKELDFDKQKQFLQESAKTAPVFIRRNLLKCTAQKLMQAFKEEGFELRSVNEECFEMVERKNVFNTKIFKNGWFEVQDGASQEVAHFLDLSKDMRIADTCAGAGGKALHISALMENRGKVVAMDIFPRRLEELKKRSKRAGCQNVEIKPLTGSKVIKRMKEQFDRVLLDVPCTGTGTYRRKPEAKIFFTSEEHQRLLKTQQEILDLHSQLVKPGGFLVYATCSVLSSENQDQVQSFLQKQTHFDFVEEKNNFVGQKGFDGFYMAKLKRVSV